MSPSRDAPGNRKRRPTRHLAVWIVSGVFVLTGLAMLSAGMWIKVKAGLAQILLEHAFATPAGETAKPWPWADTEPVARVDAPHLGASAIILAGTSGEALAFGPGHLSGTPMPGEAGTTVFAAHRDTHFSWLGDLRPGDRVSVTDRNGVTFGYEMQRFWIARWDSPGIDAASHEERIALTTCWPLDADGETPWRYVALGVRVDADQALAETGPDVTLQEPL